MPDVSSETELEAFCQRIDEVFETRKPTRAKGVANDASARPTNLSLVTRDLDYRSFVVTQWAVTVIRTPVAFGQNSSDSSLERDFFAIYFCAVWLWRLTSCSDPTAKVDPCCIDHLCGAILHRNRLAIFFQNVFTSLVTDVTNGYTDGRTDRRQDERTTREYNASVGNSGTAET